jgi:hypothetical protein
MTSITRLCFWDVLPLGDWCMLFELNAGQKKNVRNEHAPPKMINSPAASQNMCFWYANGDNSCAESSQAAGQVGPRSAACGKEHWADRVASQGSRQGSHQGSWHQGSGHQGSWRPGSGHQGSWRPGSGHHGSQQGSHPGSQLGGSQQGWQHRENARTASLPPGSYNAPPPGSYKAPDAKYV